MRDFGILQTLVFCINSL